MLAAEKDNSRAVRLLMDKGADITIVDRVSSPMNNFTLQLISLGWAV